MSGFRGIGWPARKRRTKLVSLGKGESDFVGSIESLHDKVTEIMPTIARLATEVSLEIHRHPELSLKEYAAAKLLQDTLDGEGFEIESPLANLETGFRAVSGDGSHPIIAYLLEYDALPEIGHACGHNLIAGGGLAAAIALHRLGSERPGTVWVVGTPGEEADGGKITELEAGVFDEVDAALMFHPGDRTVPFRHATALVDLFIQFHGVSAHAAGSPQQGRNALAAMIQFFVAIDGLRQHIPETARIHGIITHGGAAPNVVPDFTAAHFLVRALTSDTVKMLLSRVKQCAEGAALATGTTVSFEDRPLYSERKNNHVLANRVADYLRDAGESVHEPVLRGGTGSSDIGNVSLKIPAIHPYLGIVPQGTPGHSHAMREAAGSPDAQTKMMRMAGALAHAGLDFLADENFRGQVQEEFRTAGPDLPLG